MTQPHPHQYVMSTRLPGHTIIRHRYESDHGGATRYTITDTTSRVTGWTSHFDDEDQWSIFIHDGTSGHYIGRADDHEDALDLLADTLTSRP